MRRWLLPPLTLLLWLFLGEGKAAIIEYPPFPNPLPYTGFSISKLMETVDWVDPIYIEKPDNGACPSGSVPKSYSYQDQTGQLVTNTYCVSESAQDAGTYGDALKNFAINVLKQLLAQFTGDPLARFFTSPVTKRVYLHQILDGLAEAYRSTPKQDPEVTFNYLGETLNNLAIAYRDVLRMIRVVRLYGDQALNNYVQDVLNKLFTETLGNLIGKAVSDIKSVFMNAYNKSSFAPEVYNLSEAARSTVQQIAGEVERYTKDLAIGGKRSVPYVDATIAWLVENASIAEESLGNNNPFLPQPNVSPQGTISPQGDQGGNQGNSGPSGAPKLAPNQLAFIMAAKSPEVLRSLQSIAEQQENLKAQVTEKIANIDRVASLATKAIVGQRELPNALVPYKQENQSFVDKMNQLKTQTDLRDLVKTQTEIVGWLAMNQLTSAQNLELLLVKLVEEGVKTRQILLDESTKQIDEQIAELEKVKNELTTNVLSLAEDATKSLSLLDNIDNMVSVLAVSDRAGLVLTEDQFKAMLSQPSSPPSGPSTP
jgi:hypothetical protein